MISAHANSNHTLTAILVAIPALLVGALIAFVGGTNPLIIYAVLILAPIIVINYRIGVWLLVFVLPFASTRLIPREILGITGLNPVNMLLMLTLASLFTAFLAGRGVIQLVHLPRLLLAYVAVIALGAYVGAGSAEQSIILPDDVTNAVEPVTVAGYLMGNVAKPMIILIVAWLAATVARNGNGRPLIWALAASYVAYFLVIVGHVATQGILASLAFADTRGFLDWTGTHANSVGLMANMGFAILLYTAAATTRRLPRLLLFACAAAAATTAAMTFSRGAFIGLAIILGYYLLTRRRTNEFLLALLVIVSVAWILPNAFVERATTGFQGLDEAAITAGRFDIWRALLPTFWDAPIIGHGLSSTLWAPPNLRGEMPLVGHPHNAYLGVLLDLGLVGIAVVGAFFWSIWRTFRRLSQDHVDAQWRGVFEGGVVALLCFVIQCLTDDRFTPNYSQAALWVCYGLALGHIFYAVRSRTRVVRTSLGAPTTISALRPTSSTAG